MSNEGLTVIKDGGKVPDSLPGIERPRKICIVGYAPSKDQAPFGDNTWEIWGLNDLYEYIPRWTRWFELHNKTDLDAYMTRGGKFKHISGLQSVAAKCPLYMQEAFPDIPGSIRYPREIITALYGNYFTNSVSYMIALAVFEGCDELAVYGVDMAQESEYCVAPETRVLTADLRWIPISDVKVGQELMGFDEEVPETDEGNPKEFRKYRKAIVEKMTEFIRPSYRLHMDDGTKLVCSKEHNWLTLGANMRRWQSTEVLQPQDVYPVHTSKIVKLTKTWDTDDSRAGGYLAAAFDGEGSLSQIKRDNCSSSSMSISYAQKPNEMSDKVETYLSQFGFDYGKGNKEGGCLQYGIRGGRAERIRFLGQIRPHRLLAHYDGDKAGTINCLDNIPIRGKEFLGDMPVIGIRTSTRTFVAEGFASHNCQQRPSCEYFLGIAVGKGIKVIIPNTADMLKTRFMYGYQDKAKTAFEERCTKVLADVEGRRNAAQQQVNQMSQVATQLTGAADGIRTLMKIWG